MAPRPKDYDTVSTEYESLTPGGHKCVIKQVTEEKSSTGKDMIVVYFDTDNADKQPGFFMNRYISDTREEKKWPHGGIYRIVVQSDYYAKNIKSFITAVEHSNDGFTESPAIWNDLNMYLKGKKVGVVFRKEYYTDPNTHEARSAIKPCWFRKYDTVEQEPVPEDKLDKAVTNSAFVPVQEAIPFTSTTTDPLADAGLPFC